METKYTIPFIIIGIISLIFRIV